ncbi:MAG: cupin [Bacteroidetes bacterium]|nr:MAG: cupin [Bacteroidota bacterium]
MDKQFFNAATAYTLSDSVDYAPQSIVSRIIKQNDRGGLTLFAFDAGQGLSEHTAPFDAIVQVVEGTATILIDGKPHEVAAGQFIIMPANVPHAVEAKQPFKMLLSMIKA